MHEVGVRVVLVEAIENEIIDGLDRGDDEQAAGALELGEQRGVLDDVLDLDGRVVGDLRELLVQRACNAKPVGGTVEKVGIAEGDVHRAGRDLVADIGHHHVHGHGAEAAVVHRNHRAVAAKVLAAAARLGESDHALAAVRQVETRVARERGKPVAIGRHEPDLVEADHVLHLLCAVAGADALGGGQQRGLELAAEHGADTEVAEKRLVDGRVKPVDAQVRLGCERLDAWQRLERDARRGVHGQIDGDHAGAAQHLGVEAIERQIQAVHPKSGPFQPGGGLGEPERLTAELVGVDQSDEHTVEPL